MKTILILTSLLILNTSAQARQYVAHVNHISNIRPEHAALNNLLQKDITIDTAAKTMQVRLSPACVNNVCPEMLKVYRLNIKKIGPVIVAEGILPLQSGPLQAPSRVMITMEKNLDNATVVKIQDAAGTSTLIASPLQETTLIF